MPGMYAQVSLSIPRNNPPLLIPGDTLVVRSERAAGGRGGPAAACISRVSSWAGISATASRCSPVSKRGSRWWSTQRRHSRRRSSEPVAP